LSYEIYRLKHDLMSLLFKIRSSLEISPPDEEFINIALENLDLLQKVLERLFLLDRILRGDYRVKEEDIHPYLLVKEVFGLDLKGDHLLKGDPQLFAVALTSLKDILERIDSVKPTDKGVILEGKVRLSTEIDGFFLEFSREILSIMGVRIGADSSKIELTWEGS